MQYTPKDIKRFWQKVNKDGSIPAHCPELGQCWEWLAGLNTAGYGQFSQKSKKLSAHRVSYELNYDNIPDDLFVLHKCDNPKCVNPYHLFLGTPKDNTTDMFKKGRNAPIYLVALKGEEHGRSKMTRAQVVEIRKQYLDGVKQQVLAKMYGLHQSHISAIVNYKVWKGY